MEQIIELFVLLALSAVFSGSETALTSVTRARSEALAKEGKSGAQALLRLKGNPNRMLITLLIGNNLVNIAAAAIATVIATEWLGAIGPGVAVGVLTFLILVFGEVTPKSLAIRYSTRISLIIAPVILALSRILFPFVWLLERFTDRIHDLTGARADHLVTEREVMSLLAEGAKEGTIEKDERELVERVFAFTELRVEDVMTPRHQVFSMDSSRTVEDALPELLQRSFSRIPVYDEEPEAVRKVVFLREVLETVAEDKNGVRLSEISHEPMFVPENQPIDELFSALRTHKQHMAVVVDEHGGLRGLITLEDVLEELVGEIYDETDKPLKTVREAAEGQLSVDGGAELRTVTDYFQQPLSGKPTDTVSLWVLTHAERIPRVGEQFTIDGLSVRVEQATHRRIHRVRIWRTGLEEEAEAGFGRKAASS